MQVEYVLADKTGTLTQNIMAFVCCSIGGIAYGKKPNTITKNSETTTPNCRPSVHLVAQDSILKENFTTNSDTGRLCCHFFTHLALCHNVYPRIMEEVAIKYQAASPDEAALVQGKSAGPSSLVFFLVAQITMSFKTFMVIHDNRIWESCDLWPFYLNR